MNNSSQTLKSFIKESVQTTLVEDVRVKKAILENRKVLVEQILAINEADWFDRARKWAKNKALGAEQNAKDFYQKNVLVNPKELTSNPNKVKKILDSSLGVVEKEITTFKSGTLQSSEKISRLLDSVTGLFSKFFNLLDEIPEKERGVYEAKVLRTVGMFYLAMSEEKKRIDTYLSILSKEAQSQGYNLARSAETMAKNVTQTPTETPTEPETPPPARDTIPDSMSDTANTIPDIARGFRRQGEPQQQPQQQPRVAGGFRRR